jgi:choline dehydrogenase-like flavoprotein
MSAAEMRPVFERVERDVHARVVPDDAHSPNNRLLLDGARALGWRAGAVMINARGCVRSGFCGMGCRYDARQGTLATYVPRAVAAGARLIPDARAERIEVVGRGNGSTAIERHAPSPLKRVTVSILDPRTRRPKRSISIEAPVVVLAAGAIGTPALLQRSGLGGGGVGRFLRLHPTTAVFGLHDREVYAAAGIPQSVMCEEHLRRDANGYGYWIECPPMHPMLAAVAGSGFGVEHRAMMLEFPRTASLIALVRDGADREMSNGSVQVDRGERVRIRYRLGPADTRHTIEAIESTARLHLAAGAREVVTLHTEPYRIRSERDLVAMRSRALAPNDVALFSAHVNGTCRIGTDPRTSGATPDGERHGVRGLYICDGSLFPTAPGVNPQETIMALGLVMAERVKV